MKKHGNLYTETKSVFENENHPKFIEFKCISNILDCCIHNTDVNSIFKYYDTVINKEKVYGSDDIVIPMFLNVENLCDGKFILLPGNIPTPLENLGSENIDIVKNAQKTISSLVKWKRRITLMLICTEKHFYHNNKGNEEAALFIRIFHLY